VGEKYPSSNRAGEKMEGDAMSWFQIVEKVGPGDEEVYSGPGLTKRRGKNQTDKRKRVVRKGEEGGITKKRSRSEVDSGLIRREGGARP